MIRVVYYGGILIPLGTGDVDVVKLKDAHCVRPDDLLVDPGYQIQAQLSKMHKVKLRY